MNPIDSKARTVVNHVVARTRSYLGVTVVAAWMISSAVAQQVVYVSGLELPTKVITIPNGYLLVTEVGSKPNTGRVTLVAPGGSTRGLVAGLPSGLSYPTTVDPDGTEWTIPHRACPLHRQWGGRRFARRQGGRHRGSKPGRHFLSHAKFASEGHLR